MVFNETIAKQPPILLRFKIYVVQVNATSVNMLLKELEEHVCADWNWSKFLRLKWKSGRFLLWQWGLLVPLILH